MTRQVAYVAHPLGAGPDREANRQRAMRWCNWVARSLGMAPSADWITLSGIWDETPENRALGIECDLAQVVRCSRVLLVGGRISDGMRQEATYGNAAGVHVYDLTFLGNEPPAEYLPINWPAHRWHP